MASLIRKPSRFSQKIGRGSRSTARRSYGTRPIKPYELGNVFFTSKADGTVYAIALSSKDGEPMPASVTLPTELIINATKISLIGGDNAALSFSPDKNRDTTEVRLPSGAILNNPIAHAWALKIEK